MKRLISIFLVIVIISLFFTSCEIDNRHVEVSTGDNKNEDIQGWDDQENFGGSGWDDAIISTWEEVDDLSQWVRAQILFDDITDEYASVECIVLDYQSNGQYFDPDRVYTLVGEKFDLNPLIAKFAIGTGVIVICVVINVATAGATTPVACFFAGAAQASISAAIKGAAFGSAMSAVSAAIQSEGDLDKTFYGALEGAADGYMWGAVFGAISGGMNSQYCFTENTLVQSSSGFETISNMSVGDMVLSYNIAKQSFEYMPISNVIVGTTNDTVKIRVGDEILESTYNHPYKTSEGWVRACDLAVGDSLLSNNNTYKVIESIEYQHYDEAINTYNLTISENHTYLVGCEEIVVHNRCNINSEFSGKTKYFDKGTPQAQKYPNGVQFSQNGYPRFEPYAAKTVKFDMPSQAGVANGTCLTGVYTKDARLANALCGYSSTPSGYVWHHVEDMQTMILVPQDVHSIAFGGIAHSGGASLIRALLQALT